MRAPSWPLVRVRLYLEGKLDPELGWVVDFEDITTVFSATLQLPDPHYLNEIKGLENPTSEQFTVWIWGRVEQALPNLSEVEVRKTCTSGCVYQGYRSSASLKNFDLHAEESTSATSVKPFQILDS